MKPVATDLLEAQTNNPITKHPSGYPIEGLGTISGLLIDQRKMKTRAGHSFFIFTQKASLWICIVRFDTSQHRTLSK